MVGVRGRAGPQPRKIYLSCGRMYDAARFMTKQDLRCDRIYDAEKPTMWQGLQCGRLQQPGKTVSSIVLR